MESIGFESLVQAFGAPAALAIWIIWNLRGKAKVVDPGTALMNDMSKVLQKLDDQSNRITVLEVKLEERTRK